MKPPKNFHQALKTAGLEAEFIAFCKTGARNADVVKWARARPQLAASLGYIPLSFNDLRNRLKCPGSRGGKRPPPANGRFHYVRKGAE